jgi:hypothetical protein
MPVTRSGAEAPDRVPYVLSGWEVVLFYGLNVMRIRRG